MKFFANKGLALALLCACQADVNSFYNSTDPGDPKANDSNSIPNAPESSEQKTKTEDYSNTKVPATDPNNAPQESSSESEDTESSSFVDAPAPVGGAFLSCAPVNPLSSNDVKLVYDCELQDYPGSAYPISQAAFFISDGTNLLSPLPSIETPGEPFKWRVDVPLRYVQYKTLVAQLQPEVGPVFTIEASIQPLDKKSNPPILDFWVFGEPNNRFQDEYCVEALAREGVRNLSSFNDQPTPKPLGILNDFSCTAPRRALCRSLTNSPNPFLISQAATEYEEAWDNCPTGTIFSFPNTNDEIRIVLDLLDRTFPPQTNINSVWVAIRAEPAPPITFLPQSPP